MSKSKLLATVSALAVTLGAAPAFASGPYEGPPPPAFRWYVSGFVGYSWPNDYEFAFVNNASNAAFNYVAPLDNGFTAGGAIGLIINPNIRTELELTWASFDFTNTYRSAFGFIGVNPTGSIDMTTLMANIWFNANYGALMPYIGGGLGVGWVDGDLRVTNGAGQQFSGSDTVFAAQLGGGIRYAISSNMELDLGYRAKFLFDVGFPSSLAGFHTTDDSMLVHTIQAGLTVKF